MNDDGRRIIRDAVAQLHATERMLEGIALGERRRKAADYLNSAMEHLIDAMSDLEEAAL